jgi:two-component system OmpR family response regulator
VDNIINLPQSSASKMNVEATPLRVLLVEDSEILADQISELLASTTGTTRIGVVATEGEAIAFSAEHDPDLLILDLHLKQGTGFGVLKALSRFAKRPTVVVLTNYALPQYREQAFALGAQHFLDKSADFGLLSELLEDIAKQQTEARASQRAN